MITNVRYHKIYDSNHISTQDTNMLLEGMTMLIELGADRYKKGIDNWRITDRDIERVFTQLGGGSMFTLSDGRTVLEWWRDGSSIGTKVTTGISFSERLKEFNYRIESLVDANYDYEKWLNKFYKDTNLPDWIDKGKIQLDQYLWMVENLRHLHYYVHMEDVDFLRDTWGI